MRDPTRGGLTTIAHEISHATRWQANLQQAVMPVRNQVPAVCEMLGYARYYLTWEVCRALKIYAHQAIPDKSDHLPTSPEHADA